MEKRLFTTQVIVELVVVAHSSEEAEDVALENAKYELGNAIVEEVYETESTGDLPYGWSLEKRPYSKKGDRVQPKLKYFFGE